MNKETIDALLQKINDSATSEGNARTKTIVNRIVRDLFYTIEDLDVDAERVLDRAELSGRNGTERRVRATCGGLGL